MKPFGKKDGILIGEMIETVEHDLLNWIYNSHFGDVYFLGFDISFSFLNDSLF